MCVCFGGCYHGDPELIHTHIEPADVIEAYNRRDNGLASLLCVCMCVSECVNICVYSCVCYPVVLDVLNLTSKLLEDQKQT